MSKVRKSRKVLANAVVMIKKRSKYPLILKVQDLGYLNEFHELR